VDTVATALLEHKTLDGKTLNELVWGAIEDAVTAEDEAKSLRAPAGSEPIREEPKE
jgi:hypothetical protein